MILHGEKFSVGAANHKGDTYEKGRFWGLPPPHGDMPATGLVVRIDIRFVLLTVKLVSPNETPQVTL